MQVGELLAEDRDVLLDQLARLAELVERGEPALLAGPEERHHARTLRGPVRRAVRLRLAARRVRMLVHVSLDLGGPVLPALRLRRLLVAVAAGGLAATMGPAAAARADDPVTVPDPAAITLTGDGYGHGVGLSQYGAYSAAHNGLAGYKKILRSYYRGIDHRFGGARGKMKVLVSADDGTLIVRDAPGLVVRRVDTGRTFHLDGVKKAKRWRVRARGARSEVAYKAKGWHVLRTIRGDAELQAHGPLSLFVAGGVRDYRGALRSASYDGHRVTVDVLPMEAYVRGVVTSEMYASWPQQALRAQAVASRTYAAYERKHTNRAAYDLCDTASCQAYRGVAGESSGGTAAARATAHQVLTYDGDLAYAQFSASNGGWTVRRRPVPLPPGAPRRLGGRLAGLLRLDGDALRRGHRGAVAGDRQPDVDHRRPARRQRPQGRPGWPGAVRDAHGGRGVGPGRCRRPSSGGSGCGRRCSRSPRARLDQADPGLSRLRRSGPADVWTRGGPTTSSSSGRGRRRTREPHRGRVGGRSTGRREGARGGASPPASGSVLTD